MVGLSRPRGHQGPRRRLLALSLPHWLLSQETLLTGDREPPRLRALSPPASPAKGPRNSLRGGSMPSVPKSPWPKPTMRCSRSESRAHPGPCSGSGLARSSRPGPFLPPSSVPLTRFCQPLSRRWGREGEDRGRWAEFRFSEGGEDKAVRLPWLVIFTLVQKCESKHLFP